MRKKMLWIVALVAAMGLVAAACEGPAGPQRPRGPLGTSWARLKGPGRKNLSIQRGQLSNEELNQIAVACSLSLRVAIAPLQTSGFRQIRK